MPSIFKQTILKAAMLACVLAAPVLSLAAEEAVAPATQAQTWASVPTRFVAADGVDYAYRELGRQHGGTPVIFLNHLAAVLDNWDPRVVDGIAARHHVIVFDNRGVGASGGAVPDSMEQMADDALAFIHALGYRQVDLFGFSMGGMIAQEVALKQPGLVRKLILAGSGPAGGEGISAVTGVANYDLLRAVLTGQDPKQFLFFTRSPGGIAAGKAFLARLQERAANRDKEISPSAYIAQLRALYAWGQKPAADLSVLRQPVLVANGDQDRMVPTVNSHELARRLPNSRLVIYPDAGHGGVFQFHDQFVAEALNFLAP